MQHKATRAGDAVELEAGGWLLRLRWFQNRLHYQPGVYRLTWEGFPDLPQELPSEHVSKHLRVLFAEARAALAEHRPSVMRVTVASASPLLPHLRRLGFLSVRGVHILELQVADLLEAAGSSHDGAFHLLPLEEARPLVPDDDLMTVWEQAYARAARLDLATPEMLFAEERRSLFLGDEDLDTALSICAFSGDSLVGICPVYSGDDEREREIGTTGVADGWEGRHVEASLAMIRGAAARAQAEGVELLVAEVDADAPYIVHTYAALPGKVVESLESLMYVPQWDDSGTG